MTDNKDQCQYNSCHHPLGPYVPTKNIDGFVESEERTCEKCGGRQWRAIIVDEEMLKASEELFAALEGEKDGKE